MIRAQTRVDGKPMSQFARPLSPLADPRTGNAARSVLGRHAPVQRAVATRPTRFEAAWARDEDEVREAQRLRYIVFAEEMGARLSAPPGIPACHDADLFDPFCEHLLVRAATRDGQLHPVVGTYRLLTPAAARRVGGLYSDGEFDLVRLRPLRAKMVELGRACVHPDWRAGGAIMALWGALAQFMLRNGLDTMVGCASVSMQDGGHCAASLWQRLRRIHLAPIEWHVQPRLPLPVDELRVDLGVEPPALIKGSVRRHGIRTSTPPTCP
jgi:putative hemolysin